MTNTDVKEMLCRVLTGTEPDNYSEPLFLRVATINLAHNNAMRASVLHGFQHWSRVLAYARMLSHMMEFEGTMRTEALFAAMHDSMRKNEDYDEWHGGQATNALLRVNAAGQSGGLMPGGSGLSVAHAMQLSVTFKECGVDLQEVMNVADACERHTVLTPEDFDASLEGRNEMTKQHVRICLDADRLDYGRLGTPVESKWLFTDEAKQIAEVLNEINFG